MDGGRGTGRSRMGRRRRGTLGTALGMVAGSWWGAVGCGGQDASRPAAPASAPITLRAFIGGIDAAGVGRWEAEIATPYRERRAHVTLELISQAAQTSGATAEVVEKLTAMIAAGDPPDINDLPRPARQQVGLGFLEEIDRFVKRDKFDSRQFNQKEFELQAIHDGKVWQIPYKYLSNALLVVLNRGLCEAEGVSLPSGDPATTWDWPTFVAAMNRLTSRSGGRTTRFGLANYGSATYTWSRMWQADWVSADGKTAVCDSPDMQTAFTSWIELIHRLNVIPRPGQASELFGTSASLQLFLGGNVGAVIMSPGTWRNYITQSTMTDVALTPLPKGKISTPDISATSLGVVRGSKQPAESWEVIKYLSEGSRLALFAQYLPAILKDVEPWARADLGRFPHADPRVVLRVLETHGPGSSLSGHRRQDDLLRVISPAIDPLVAGQEAPVAWLRRLKPELQAVLDRP